jgi:zinc D-Ala-D-Ala carboxypeptidase
MRRLRWMLVWIAMIVPAAAMALAPVRLCNGQDVEPMPDGRMLGHLPYAEGNPADLVTIANFGAGRPCVMHRDAAAAMTQLLAAAAKVPGVAGKLRGISCFRTIERQRQIFCSQIGPGKRCANAAERARSSGPPGYSEHSTGYALDIGIRPLTPGCGDVSDCIARTVPGRWLLAHATEFGFELSFPPGKAQGVTWEPWHWRWVGTGTTAPGAPAARALFAVARSRFPANPGIPDLSPQWINALGQPAPPAAPIPAPSGTPPVVWPK